MMKLSAILIKSSSLAILCMVSADQISGNSRTNNSLYHIKMIVKRPNGWGLPIMFHSIIPGKISSKKRELREAARNASARASEQGNNSKTKSKDKNKDKQTEREPKQNQEPSTKTILTEPSSSLTSQSSLKKKNKEKKDFPSSFTV